MYFGSCWGIACKRDDWQTPRKPLPDGVLRGPHSIGECPNKVITRRERTAYDLLRLSGQYGDALPAPGSLLDQPAWLVSAHRTLSDALATIAVGRQEKAARLARLKAKTRS